MPSGVRADPDAPTGAAARHATVEDYPQGSVNSAHLLENEITDTVAEPARVDGGGLLSQHPGDAPADPNLGAKARRPRGGGVGNREM